MFKILILLAATLLVIALQPTGLADDFVQFDAGEVTVCPVDDVTEPPPVPTSSRCHSIGTLEVDPNHRALWVIGTITPSDQLLQSDRPIGLFLSARAASRVYLNGLELGSNGHPGLNRASEQAGRIDAVFLVRRDQLNQDGNRIAILMSGQRSLIRSGRSLLTLGFFTYLEPPYHDRDRSWLTLLTFGVFAISGLYAGVLACLRLSEASPVWLAAASLFAAGQVLAETLRSLWSYPYPVHDLRLAAIILCGLGVGMASSAHTLQRFRAKRPRAILLAVLTATVIGIALSDGFDGKASISIMLPSILTGLIALRYALQGDRWGWLYAAAYTGFAGINWFNPGDFLDTNYFLILATFVLVLSGLQAAAFRDAIQEREEAAQNRRQLEIALARATDDRVRHLLIRHSGKTERVPCDEIAYLCAAGDYVVIRLIGGRELMHTGSLTTFGKQFPASFLRTHRSYIVNTDLVASFKRSPSGAGELYLSTGDIIPVSRRIMPRVSKALAAT